MGEDRELEAAIAALAAGQERPYYDEAADEGLRGAYYERVEAGGGGEALRLALAGLVGESHVPRPPYKPALLVYPWVDLHPDRQLRSVYSGRAFAAQELIEADLRIEAQRTARLQALVARESAVGPRELEAEFDALEAELPFNCEHVVPQSWFSKDEPMRGDLHHLFACESGCNSFRGNTPYGDFPDFMEVVREACGKREEERFEPASGKGPVARAVFYFLLRYPQTLRAAPDTLDQERLGVLLGWHEAEPVSEYERHRNAAIAEIQGNRNPLIDYPEWAGKVSFAATLG